MAWSSISGSGSLRRLHSRYQLGLHLSKGSNGIENLFSSSLAWLLAASLSSLPFGSMCKAAHTMATGVPRSDSRDGGRGRERNTAFMT